MGQSRISMLKNFAGAFSKLIKNKERSFLLTNLQNHIRFLDENCIPVEYLVRLFPGIEKIKVKTDVAVDHHFGLPYGESTILSAIIEFLKPRSIFEFGTFTGSTTRFLAEISAPETDIHTIDLPDGEFVWEPWIAEVIGQEFRGIPEYSEKIKLHRCSTRNFDFSPFYSKIDLVFVDASHEYEDVLHDSLMALKIVSEKGLIVWDDYQANTYGVVAALNEIFQKEQLVRVANSRFVLYRKKPFSGITQDNFSSWNNFPDRGKPEPVK